MKLSNQKWGVAFVAVFLLLLMVFGGLTAIVDPYFHYHKPLESLQYRISNERYVNDGIVKHFDYDAIITGTSMTQNFKTTEFDRLFGVNSVKVPFSGGGYQEINNNLKRALAANPDLSLILRGLDYNMLCLPPDWTNYSVSSFPDYLYDTNPLNDVSYIFNKEILFNETLFTLKYTKDGGKTTTFDEYNNWMKEHVFGKEALLAGYPGPAAVSDTQVPFSEEDREMVRENLTQNVTDLADQYPDVEFYLFVTPYSIYYFDSLYRNGSLERQLEIEEYATELLLQHENIHLFSFFTEFDIITNPDNYKDIIHYGEWVNSQMLEWMASGHDELTKENYQDYFQQMREFYLHYDYDSIF